MKANELRIGNLIERNGMYSKIYSIDKKEFITFETKEIVIGSYKYEQSPSLHISAFKPIPLTEEILLKCGFEITKQTEHPNNIWTVYGEECKFELEHITSFYLYDNKCFGTKVQYLHQLQNLYFALTNEELTVNL